MHPVWATLPGLVLGVALQLQQPALWTRASYLALLALAMVVAAGLAFWRQGHMVWRLGAGCLVGVLLAVGSTGWRATHRLERILTPELEGVDLVVTGQIVSMPQRGADSDRFEFDVEDARRAGQTVQLPPRLLLGDFRGDNPGRDWRAGDRWRLTVRLKRPHGQSNPHGFDRERWLWDQGLGATGYLRDGPRDPAPLWLGKGFHPLERARQWVAERIRAQVPDARSAGVLAALVVGDQSAIERADWALFRDTGVAHLMSISGLHVTVFAWLATGLIGWGWRRLGWVWPRALLAVPAPLAAGWGGAVVAGENEGSIGDKTAVSVHKPPRQGAIPFKRCQPQGWVLRVVVIVVAHPYLQMQMGTGHFP